MNKWTLMYTGILALVCSPAIAESPKESTTETDSVAAEARPTRLGEIVVTAEKRSALMQDVPIAISAFTGDDIAKSGLQNTMDLQTRSPGVIVTTHIGQVRPYIRGVGTDILGPGVEQGIAIYVDGVYVPRAPAALQQFSDISRVEILKGPQGLLYGRNATGGLINIISQRPSADLSFDGSLQLGNYDERILRGTISGPLGGDKVRGRLSGLVDRNDGYSLVLNTGKGTDTTDTVAVRGALEILASENFTALLSASYTDQGGDVQYYNLNPETSPQVLARGAALVPGRPRHLLLDARNDYDTKQYTVSATLDWSLDRVSVRSISAFNNMKWKIFGDWDGTEVPLIVAGMTGKPMHEYSDYWSQEVILTSNLSGRLDWTALLVYMKEDVDWRYDAGFPVFGFSNLSLTTFDNEAYAVAGQVGYYVLPDKLRISAGARWSHEEKDYYNTYTRLPAGTLLFGTPISELAKWDNVTPRFGIEYHASNRVMYYASAAKGFKSGGFDAVTPQESFEPEELWSYEAGVKSMLFDERLRVNASAFYYDYSNMQVQKRFSDISTGGAISRIENAAKSSVQGLDLELLALLSDNLELEVNLSYLDAKFDEYITIDSNNPSAGEVDRKGNPLPKAPKFSGYFGLQYTLPLPGRDEQLTFRGEYFYRDKIYFDAFKTDVASQDSIGLVNARIGWESTDGRISAAVFGRNLTDELYVVNMFNVQSFAGQIGFLPPPRTYGLEIAYRYK